MDNLAVALAKLISILGNQPSTLEAPSVPGAGTPLSSASLPGIPVSPVKREAEPHFPEVKAMPGAGLPFHAVPAPGGVPPADLPSVPRAASSRIVGAVVLNTPALSDVPQAPVAGGLTSVAPLPEVAAPAVPDTASLPFTPRTLPGVPPVTVPPVPAGIPGISPAAASIQVGYVKLLRSHTLDSHLIIQQLSTLYDPSNLLALQ